MSEHRIRYELIDRRGRVHGPYSSRMEAMIEAERKWPDQAQDEERAGMGWDVQIIGVHRDE